MARRLPEILEEARAALLGRSKDYDWAAGASAAYDATARGLKGFSSDTLAKTAAAFNETLPFIERAGYDVLEIDVGLGISPKVAAHLSLREVISAEARTALMDEAQGKTLVRTILSSLFRAADARETLHFNRFHFALLELELSVLPSVTLKFRPDEGVPVEPDHALLAAGPEAGDAEDDPD